ncbi:MAG: aminotransferase class III-fold pyridoxal phosphate-dependent enzyme [Chloroflexi bacterium]|nr:aminotransferase class III-fold pyridoxal phosphate-dependent enzyme [Chloroflexota bacterium]
MPEIHHTRPAFSLEEAAEIADRLYGRTIIPTPLPSERDQNFHLTTNSGQEYILKISGTAEDVSVLELQNQAMIHLSAVWPAANMCPKVIAAVSHQTIETATDSSGQPYPVRLLTYLPGTLYAHLQPHDAHLQRSLGRFLGQIDKALAPFEHPAAHRQLNWDLTQAAYIDDYTQYIQDKDDRVLVQSHLDTFQQNTLPQLPHLRQQIIHNDANDYNILALKEPLQFSIIDFGDMVYAPVVCEVAIAAAYALLEQPDPILAAAQVVAGYHDVYPLLDNEISLLFNLIVMRLCVSVTMSSYQQVQNPEDAYLQISARPSWAALRKLDQCEAGFSQAVFRYACGLPSSVFSEQFSVDSPTMDGGKTGLFGKDILGKRGQYIGSNLSVSYNKPLKIVRGTMQYLYDEYGRAYLDAVNNVPHVGHCHPRVVRAGQTQMALLNSNTRYLHDLFVNYAERLVAKFPDPLNMVYLVCSGSEANELALRLARTATGRHDMLVLDGAYHGNTGELVNLSPYKFNGPGGKGAPPYVHVVPMPDPYRGLYKGYGRATAHQYAQHVQETITHLQEKGTPPAAMIAEPLLGCGGQIILPNGYLEAAFAFVRAAGGLCIADEVQIGFGRVGTHFWGFETQYVIPDIVTLGKPIGNGHPLAAVITTPDIAAAFDNGMEYFNTFGGNAVSCAIGTAVLDVIEQEHLQQNALEVGNHLLNRLRRLQKKHPLIGDVRGLGLYIGVELVRNRETLEAADTEAAAVVNQMKECGILISTDGPLHNILKIKPPLVFTKANGDLLVEMLDFTLRESI